MDRDCGRLRLGGRGSRSCPENVSPGARDDLPGIDRHAYPLVFPIQHFHPMFVRGEGSPVATDARAKCVVLAWVGGLDGLSHYWSQ